MIPFSAVVTPNSVVFTARSGKTYNLTSSHVNYDAIRDTVRDLHTARTAGDAVEVERLFDRLGELADVSTSVAAFVEGDVEVRDGVVYHLGEPVHGAITNHIVWTMKEGYDARPSMRFLSKLMQNPSKRSVDQFYDFVTTHGLTIADDGDVIAYKRVRGDFKDIWSGKLDNTPGNVVEMARNKVDDEPQNTCSKGLHACAFSYLGSYGAGPGNKVVIVKFTPADVVSIPADHNAAKLRLCRYVVVGEYQGEDLKDILGTKPTWTDAEIEDEFGSEDDDCGWEDDEVSDDEIDEECYDTGFEDGKAVGYDEGYDAARSEFFNDRPITQAELDERDETKSSDPNWGRNPD